MDAAIIEPETLSSLLGGAMARRGMSYADLGTLIKKSGEHARRIVHGEQPPTDEVLSILCRELGIPKKRCIELVNIQKRQAELLREALADSRFRRIAMLYSLLDTEKRAEVLNHAVNLSKR